MISPSKRVVHTGTTKPPKSVPMAKLPDNLVERYRARRDGSFEFYDQFSTVELDAVMSDAIPRELLEKEANLLLSKWFDYRPYHLWRSAAIFLEAYRSEHAWVMRKREDITSHWFHKGIKAKTLHSLGSQQLIALWKSRQAADSIGAPYDFYCRELLNWAEHRNWTHLPRINQLYTDDHVEVVRDLLAKDQTARLRYATEPCFASESFVGELHQHEYHRYLIAQIKRRAHPVFSLGGAVFRRRHLPESVARDYFGDALVDEARRLADQLYPNDTL